MNLLRLRESSYRQIPLVEADLSACANLLSLLPDGCKQCHSSDHCFTFGTRDLEITRTHERTRCVEAICLRMANVK